MYCLECYGKKYRIKGLEQEEFSELARGTGLSQGLLPDDESSDGEFVFTSVGAYFDLYQLGQRTIEAQPLELLIEIVKGRVASMTAQAFPELLFLRGEALRWPSGDAVLLPGPSLVGKSRLAEQLRVPGSSFWSKGVIVIDSEGALLPYPFDKVPAEERLEPGYIGLVTYDPKAVWEPEVLSAGQTVMALIPTVLTSRDDTPKILGVLGKLCSNAKWRCRCTWQDGAAVLDFLGQCTPQF